MNPETLGTVALGPQLSFGETGLLLGLLGMLMCVGGAAIDASFAGAYTLSQFLGWEWGKYRGPKRAPRFALTWLFFVFAGTALVLSGIDPVQLTEYSVVFSVVCLPLTYLPVLLVAGDANVMGEHRNGVLSNALGWFYYVLICIAALAAIPLLIMTHGGEG